MAQKNIITVFGATGVQGGSVLNYLTAHPWIREQWKLRGVTRDPTKEKAKALVNKGVEMVAADMNDKKSLVEAIKDSHTVFAVTNYWETMDDKVEIQQGKNMADAAKETGIKHYIWSTLRNTTKLSNGALPNIEHFDSKAAVSEYIQSINLPATFFLPGFYMGDLFCKIFRRQTADGPYTVTLPIPRTAVAPLFDPASDTGKIVGSMVIARENGKLKDYTEVFGAPAYTSFGEAIDAFARVYPEEGARFVYKQVSDEEFKQASGLPPNVAQGMLEVMKLLDTVGYYGGDSLDASLETIKEPLTSVQNYVKNVKEFAGLK